MDVADMLLDKMVCWVDLQKQSAEKLNSLADELEKHKKNVNISQVVGSSVSVGGAVAMTAAGIISIFTGGLAIPILAIGGAVASGLALANNVGSEVTNAVISSGTMKEAEEIAKKIENLEKGTQKLLKVLKKEGQKREQQARSCADASEDDYVVERILRAMAKREGLHLHHSISLCNMTTALSKYTITGKDTGVSLVQRSALGLSVLSKFGIEAVAKTSGKKVVSKLVPELVTSVGPKAAAKAVGRVSIRESDVENAKRYEAVLFVENSFMMLLNANTVQSSYLNSARSEVDYQAGFSPPPNTHTCNPEKDNGSSLGCRMKSRNSLGLK